MYTVVLAATQFLTFLLSFILHALKVTWVEAEFLYLLNRVHKRVVAIHALQSTGEAEKMDLRNKDTLTQIIKQAELN